MSHRFSLVGILPGALPGSVLLDPGKWVVGRSSTCAIPLKDQSVSRRHAEILVTESDVAVTDLGSCNGTFVEGKRVQTCQLRSGQSVRFGRVTFILGEGKPVSEEVDSELDTN